MYYFGILCVFPGKSTKGAQLACTIGRNDYADTLGASITIRCVSGIQLIGALDPLEVRVITNGVADRVHEIAGNAECICNAEVFKSS